MSWTDRFRRLTSGDPERAVVDELRVLHQRSAERVERFTAYAGQAPTAAAEHEFRQLAEGEATLTSALAEALAARGVVVSAAPSAVLNGGAPNHWARVVAAMDSCREAHE